MKNVFEHIGSHLTLLGKLPDLLKTAHLFQEIANSGTVSEKQAKALAAILEDQLPEKAKMTATEQEIQVVIQVLNNLVHVLQPVGPVLGELQSSVKALFTPIDKG